MTQVARQVMILVAALVAAVAINPVVIMISCIVDIACSLVVIYAIYNLKSMVPLTSNIKAISLAVLGLLLMSIISTPIYMTSMLIDAVFAITVFIALIPLIQAAQKSN